MNNLERAQYMKKRFDRETWGPRRTFLIKKAKQLIREFKFCKGMFPYGAFQIDGCDCCGEEDYKCPECKQALELYEEIK